MTSREMLYLNRNEYFFPHPAGVFTEKTEECLSHYASPEKHHALREALAQAYGAKEQHIFLGHGAEDLFVKMLCWFRKEVDTVFMEDFAWTTYLHIASGFGYQVRCVPTIETSTAFAFDEPGFTQALAQEKHALVFVTSPNNPTGHIVNLDSFLRLVESYPNHIFILDSVYNRIHKDDYAAFFSLKNFILVGSFSKFFGMPGLRLGYAIGHLPMAFWLHLGLQPSAIQTALAALNHFSVYQHNRESMLAFSKSLLAKPFEYVTIYPSEAPFFLAKAKQNELNFSHAEHMAGVVPKYIHKQTGTYLRFGLGPTWICERIQTYFDHLKPTPQPREENLDA